MQTREMTDEEQRVLREGLRILARMIARHHLGQREAERLSGAPASADEDSRAVQSERNRS